MKPISVESVSDAAKNEKSEDEINKYIFNKLSLIFNNDTKSLPEDATNEINRSDRSESGMKVEKVNKQEKEKEEKEKSGKEKETEKVDKPEKENEKEDNGEEEKERMIVVEGNHTCVFEKTNMNRYVSELESLIFSNCYVEKMNNVNMSDLSSLCKYSGDVIHNLDQRLKRSNLSDLVTGGGNTVFCNRKNERWKRYIKYIEPFLDVNTIINLSQTCKFFYKRKYKVGNNRLVFSGYLGHNPKILYEFVLPRIYKLIHRSVRRKLCLDFSLCTLIKDITVANVLNQIYRFDALNTKHLFVYNIQEIYFDYCHHLTDKTLEVLAQTRLPLLRTLSIKCVRNKYLTCAPLSVMLKKSNWPVFTNFICSFSNAWLEPIFIISNFIVNRANNENHIIYHKLKNIQKTLEHIKSFESTIPSVFSEKCSGTLENQEHGKKGMGSAVICNVPELIPEGECLFGEKYVNSSVCENPKRETMREDSGGSYLFHVNSGIDNNSIHKSSLIDFQKNKSLLNSETECSISQSETNNNFHLFNNFLNTAVRHLGYSPKDSSGFNFMEQGVRSKKSGNVNSNSTRVGLQQTFYKASIKSNNNNMCHSSNHNHHCSETHRPLLFRDRKDVFIDLAPSEYASASAHKGNEYVSKSEMENGYFHHSSGRIHRKQVHQNDLHSNEGTCASCKMENAGKHERMKEMGSRIYMRGTHAEVDASETKSDFRGDRIETSKNRLENMVPDTVGKYKSMKWGEEEDASIAGERKKSNFCEAKDSGVESVGRGRDKEKERETSYAHDGNKKSGIRYKNDIMNEERKKKKKTDRNECFAGNRNSSCGRSRSRSRSRGKKNKALLTVENIFCMNILHNNVNTFDEEEDDEEEEEYDENGNPSKCRCNGKSCIFFSDEINYKCDCDDCPFSKGYKNLISVDDPYIQSHFIKPNLDILGSWGSKCFLESIGLDIYVKGYSVALKKENIKICVKLTKKIQEELYELSKSEKYKNNNLVYLVRDKGSELLSNTPLTIETKENGEMDIWTLPISLAISKKNRYLFYLVLKGGAKIDVWDYLGKSPLYIACENECKEFVEVLLEEKRKRKKETNTIEYSSCVGGMTGEVEREAEVEEVEIEAEIEDEAEEEHDAVTEMANYVSNVNERNAINGLEEKQKAQETDEGCKEREKEREKEEEKEREKEKGKGEKERETKKLSKRNEKRDTMCISPYGNTSGTHHVIIPFDIENGYIPLNISIKKKNFAIVDMLVKSGEPLNIHCPFIREYKSPLYLACENNASEIIQLLLENKADPNWCYHNKFTPTILAYNLNKAWVNHFLDAGAGSKLSDRHILTEVLSCAIFKNDLATVQLLLKKYPMLLHKSHNLWSLPFIQAAKLERLNVLKYLYNIKNEIIDQLDQNNCYAPIHVAAEEGNIDALKFLLENKANVNITNKFHQNALHIACLENQVEVVHLLLQHQIDVNCSDNINGETPLMICIRTRNEHLAEMILNEATNINYNLTNIHGETSLVYAIFYGLYYIADVLMKRGAEVTTVQDITGDKSYNVACERVLSNRTCKKVLRKFLKLYRTQNKSFFTKKKNLHGKNKFYLSYQNINEGIMKMLRLNKKRKKKKSFQYTKEPDKKMH